VKEAHVGVRVTEFLIALGVAIGTRGGVEKGEAA
jgi:hypothetical protein